MNKGNLKISNNLTPVIGSNTEAYERQTNCRTGIHTGLDRRESGMALVGAILLK